MVKSPKNFLILFFSIVLFVFVLLSINFYSNRNDIQSSFRELDLKISPNFNQNIHYYFSLNCNEDKFNALKNEKINEELNFNYPYINVSNMKNLMQKQNYTITCIPKTIPTYKVINSVPNPEYYSLTDSLILDNELSTVYDSSIAIRDSQGTPIWWLSNESPLLRGENYTFLEDPKLINNNTQVLFYASKEPIRGYSNGEYLIYDLKQSKIVKKYYGKYDANGNGNLDGHDLIIRDDNSAVGMRYKVRTDLNLTSIGISKDTPILDGEIVILNADGSEKNVISMMDLIDAKEIDLGILKYYGVKAPPYDFVHLNSIDLDGDAVIVSSRNIDAVHKINLETGKIIWRLGGFSNTKSDLKVKSVYGLNKQSFNLNKFTHVISSQHDARITSSNTLSVYDNGTYSNRNPRVIELKIDDAKLEAEIVRIHASTFQDKSNCCGSARELTNSDWLVNWGGDFRYGLDIPSIVSTINDSNIESNILMNPLGVINYRAVPYQLSDEQLNLFKQDLIKRKVDIR